MHIKHISVIGCGVIGASWAAYFLAKGFHVTAYDPAEGAENQLKELVSSFWPAWRFIKTSAKSPYAYVLRLKVT